LRAVKNQAAKDKIARIALRFIDTNRSVFLDSGSTGMSLARALPDSNFSILTSGPNIAMEVSKRYKPTVTMIGGLINRSNLAVSGMQSAQFIRSLNVDIAFIVGSAYSPKNGFTCGNYSEGEIKNLIIGKAEKTVLLIDSTKLGKSMPFTFASMQDIDVLVTDKQPDFDVMTLAQQAGVSVLWD
jgi:DeoR/GlpR family transcriptional regulator of sugar metabolism